MYPQRFPCSQEWFIRKAQRWFEEHRADVGETEGPHRVEWGFRLMQVDEKGDGPAARYIQAPICSLQPL
jgi:hypothetical protein